MKKYRNKLRQGKSMDGAKADEAKLAQRLLKNEIQKHLLSLF